MKEHRRVPLSMLRKRLKVEAYECEAPFDGQEFTPASVKIKLLQHAGKPAAPVVRQGEKVQRGALIAAVESSELGANIHASIDGTVKVVSDSLIEIGA